MKDSAGRVPLTKVHGSLNWYRAPNGAVWIFNDYAAARRHGLAIVPPVTEKQLDPWLRLVWDAAHRCLSNSQIWIVCGYSIPEYDRLVLDRFRKSSGGVTAIFVLDPNSGPIVTRLSQIASATAFGLPGLPAGLDELHERLSRFRGL